MDGHKGNMMSEKPKLVPLTDKEIEVAIEMLRHSNPPIEQQQTVVNIVDKLRMMLRL